MLGAAALGYFLDVPVRRTMAAKAARQFADYKGKPLLNIGAGTNGTALFGSTAHLGDVNVDLAGRRDLPHGTRGAVTYADAMDLRDFPDGVFGAVLASHILEHLSNPRRAIAEFMRVVGHDPGGLFIVTPSWWAPVHTFGHPHHFWFFADGAGCTKRGCTPIQLRTAPGILSDILQIR